MMEVLGYIISALIFGTIVFCVVGLGKVYPFYNDEGDDDGVTFFKIENK